LEGPRTIPKLGSTGKKVSANLFRAVLSPQHQALTSSTESYIQCADLHLHASAICFPPAIQVFFLIICTPNTITAKRSNHEAGSLPQLVENLVKNWEVEASHKTKIDDWRTVDKSKYSFAINGGEPQPAEHMLKEGTYNAIITANEYYSPEYSNFASSHKTFKRKHTRARRKYIANTIQA